MEGLEDSLVLDIGTVVRVMREVRDRRMRGMTRRLFMSLLLSMSSNPILQLETPLIMEMTIAIRFGVSQTFILR